MQHATNVAKQGGATDRYAESDAIPGVALRRRVQEIIEDHINTRRDEWERLKLMEAAEKETLNKFIAGMQGK